MAMIYSEQDCVGSGNLYHQRGEGGPGPLGPKAGGGRKPARAVVINAGIANACTGKEGMDYCKQTAKACCGKVLNIPEGEELGPEQFWWPPPALSACSFPWTGSAGGIRQWPGAGSGGTAGKGGKGHYDHGHQSQGGRGAGGLGGNTVTIGGMCKGSGMIHPNMCTMLSFMTTDAAISQELARRP